MIPKKLLKKISLIVGKDYVTDSLEDRICYSYDATSKEYLPDIIVKPASQPEIIKIVEIAATEGIPIVARGAGTGFAGGSSPEVGGIALVLARMKKIISIDEENLMAIVEPGVVTGQFQKEVEKKGLFYPPDPGSLRMSTLGGNVATCAGGPRAVKYGVTKDYVIGLEVVLAEGKVLKTGGRTLKGVVGYDLTKLLVGSEGTLGIISKIIFKLIPMPHTVRTLTASFNKIEDAARTVVDIVSSRITPSCLEFMDKGSIDCVAGFLNSGFSSHSEAMLLIEVDGEESSVDAQKDRIVQICKNNGSAEIKSAVDEKEREALWRARRSISPAIGRLNKLKLNEDITVPRNKIPEVINKIRSIGEKYNLTIINFGHAGDGNIHVNILVEKDNHLELKKGEEAVKEVFDLTLELGGTISGEHGVGIAKRPYIMQELGELSVDIMKRIKNVFDSGNIMNPGKIFM